MVVVGSVRRVGAKSKSVNSLDEHQSANITATHYSSVHSPQLDQCNPSYSVEVATKGSMYSGLNRKHCELSLIMPMKTDTRINKSKNI